MHVYVMSDLQILKFICQVVIRKRCLNQEQSLQLPPPGPDFSVYSVFCDEGGDKK